MKNAAGGGGGASSSSKKISATNGAAVSSSSLGDGAVESLASKFQQQLQMGTFFDVQTSKNGYKYSLTAFSRSVHNSGVSFNLGQVDMWVWKKDLDPPPYFLPGGKQVKIFIKRNPKIYEYDPIVCAGCCFDEHDLTECDSKIFDSIDCEADKTMQLVTVAVPMPEFYDSAQQEDTKTYDAKSAFSDS